MTFAQRVILALIAASGVLIAALINAGGSFLQGRQVSPAPPAEEVVEKPEPSAADPGIHQTATGTGVIQNQDSSGNVNTINNGDRQ